MNVIFSTLITFIYILTAYKLFLKAQVTAIYKHPLFFYTTIVLALMIICSRVIDKARTIMLFFSFIILLFYYICLMYAPSTFGL